MHSYPLANVTEQVIGAAIEVHKALGPGLLESAYESCLCVELIERGVPFERQVAIPVIYKNKKIDCAFRADLVIEDQVIVELKAVDRIVGIHEAQLFTYLRLSQRKVGLIINFNSRVLVDGILRRIL